MFQQMLDLDEELANAIEDVSEDFGGYIRRVRINNENLLKFFFERFLIVGFYKCGNSSISITTTQRIN